MTQHELFSAFVGAAIMAIMGAVVNGWQKRQDAQRTETGKRIGRLEKDADYQRGYRSGYERGRQDGVREASRVRRGRNV